MPADNATPHIQGIYETHLTVTDLKTSIPFYRDILGLELAAEFPERRIAFFWVNGKRNAMLGLWETGTAPLKMRLHMAFRLSQEEMMRAPALLIDKGLKPHGFHGELITEPIVIGWVPALSLYFNDPDGHSIEFLSVLGDEPDSAFGMRSYTEWRARR
ncbi:lactoylglutathione lyase [Rhizobium sp. BK529]|uniref:VOC family protein n=1 Tax=unclassified Rhizobium TaxID=2613769 RepID=UPI00104A9B57|nr:MULTISPECIES: VOC family protein [unclassified Rhizobium]MBB3595376.1 lactoylglutathione lyase [Rhizobium sp. BK529]TCS00832.1 lactoylglutathione lyase [Rhizobium sp. BK418]